MRKSITILLVAVGLIHLFPLVGLFGADRLLTLYGVEVVEPNLLILMRHRAVLFGLLGGLLVYAGFRPEVQPLAVVLGGVSTVSFVVLAGLSGAYNERLETVLWVDVVAAMALVVAALLRRRLRSADN